MAPELYRMKPWFPDRLWHVPSAGVPSRPITSTRVTLYMLLSLCVQFLLCGCCSATKPCPALCDPADCSTPGFPVLHCLQFAPIHVH